MSDVNTQLKIDYQLATMSFKQPKYLDNWITMDITFKQNTDEEFREKAIRDIEKMWTKEAAPFAKNMPMVIRIYVLLNFRFRIL